MSGSTFGRSFRVTTFGESHGKAIGCIIDGCPAGLALSEADLTPFMERRRPGQSSFTTGRKEADEAEILSGVFEGRTTGTPISLLIRNKDMHSKDYDDLKDLYRPGHADYTFEAKYGIRDHRGGGRSSGRETAARVAAGAVASKLLGEFGITVRAYTESIGPYAISSFDPDEKNDLYMPDKEAYEKASAYVRELMEQCDSAGGVISCIIHNVPAGLGEPVFDKLSADLAKACMSIGAVKGFEIGDGFQAALSKGSCNNDPFFIKDGSIAKKTNHAGGLLGGISDGSDIIIRCAVKPTASIASTQHTVNRMGDETTLNIKGRHDPVIVPRAVVVVESMAAITIADALMVNMSSRLDRMKEFYN